MIRRIVAHSGFRYLVAGGAAFLVDFGLLWLFAEVARWPLWLATGTAFLLSFFFTYTVQRVFAFESQSPHGIAIVKYAILVGFNTLASVGIVALFEASGAGWAIGKVVSTVVLVIWNYFAYRYWVFAGPTPKEKSA